MYNVSDSENEQVPTVNDPIWFALCILADPRKSGF